MRKLINKTSKIKNIPFYIFFDVLNIIAAVFIVNLYDQNIGAWSISYFFVFLLFCIAVFLKQYDKKYLKGIYILKEDQVFTWIIIFGIMLYPGWMTGPAVLTFLESIFEGTDYSVDDMYVYTLRMLPLMLLYPLIFAVFPFRKGFKKHHKKLDPLTGREKVFFKTIPNWVIFIFSVYLLVKYYDVLTSAFDSNSIESMGIVGRVALIIVSVMAFAIMYMPARMHFFFDSLNNRKNIISLIITIVLIVLYSMTGINLF